ncbi:hypothetical protein VPNG_10015 [Cytospora leucostoma]|uniref:Nephrocystin 3-like N-terminal domain-containing protein n=1 Tax=Cytospora leucostoma TaxID=1230097 RepID=A0A423VHF2_9PEZI|nr:hypothetical protein VPNG_10015 [Cytospora leucostoma]
MSERYLPASLLKEMNKDESIVRFDAWRTKDNTGILGVTAHYDKQRAVYTTSLENDNLGKAINTVFGDELAEVEGMIRPVIIAERALAKCVAILMAGRAEQTARRVTATQIEASRIRKNQYENHGQLMSGMEDLHRRVQEQNSIMTSLYIMVQDGIRGQRMTETNRRIKSVTRIAPSSSNNEGLLRALYDKVGGNPHVEDLAFALMKCSAFTDKALAHAAYVATTSRFHQWLTGQYSDTILIDGHCGGQVVEKVSTMSVFCATLVRSIQELPQSPELRRHLVLYFFCGQHSYQYGDHNGPSVLIASLITQLISQWPEQSLTDLPPAASGLHIRALCQIFSSLLDQLPPKINLYCILDGISDFETVLGGWADEMRVVGECIQAITTRFKAHIHADAATVKLLLASAERSDGICDFFVADQMIDLRAGHLYGQDVSPGVLVEALQGQVSYPWESSVGEVESQYFEQLDGTGS